MIRYFLAVGTILLVTACAEPRAGSGPIEFSPQVQAGYEEYRNMLGPGAFVVNQSGQAFATACPSTACRGGAISQAFRNCHEADGGECFLYDVGGKVVWRRDLPASSASLTTSQPLIRCNLRGSAILTTRTACTREGGTPIDA